MKAFESMKNPVGKRGKLKISRRKIEFIDLFNVLIYQVFHVGFR